MKNITKIDKDFKKILIIGANGFLGSRFLQLKKNEEIKHHNFQFIAADVKNSNIPLDTEFFYIDITQPKDTLKKIEKISPDIILLTAAMTNVDQNEVDKKLSILINTEGSKNVLKACKKIGSKLIFMSTDFIFDGISKEGNYNEEDIPNPLNHYGKTKLDAERAITNSEIEYIICRTAVLYGWNNEKQNFITWIINKLQHHEPIQIVTDQLNSPTLVNNLAEILLKLIEKDVNGIYHTAGDCILNRHEMALNCAEVFHLDKDLISQIESIQQKAVRPKNVGLDISKLKKLIGSELKIYNLKEGLNYMKENRL
ncbi:MAG: SDR family oxidoreductase [Candidatus Thorarchaeota archaeon]